MIFTFKASFTLLVFFSIWYYVINQQGFVVKKEFEFINSPKQWLLLILVCLLMPINWLLEAKKWQQLLTDISRISMRTAIYCILTGIAFGSFTPNRTGDYIGRTLYLPKKNRLEAGTRNISGSSIQLLITICFGLLGLLMVPLPTIPSFRFSAHWLILFALLFLILSVFIVKKGHLTHTLLSRLPFLKNFSESDKKSQSLKNATIASVFFLSFLRYIVFSSQFILLLYIFNIPIQANTIYLVFISYLIMAIIPSFALAEIGIREAVTLFTIGTITDNSMGIILATFFIWTINLAIPSIAGSILIVNKKSTP